MNLFHSDKTKVIKTEMTESGIIKMTQVKLDNNGSISATKLNDPNWILAPKDITPQEYKGLLYTIPIPDSESFIAISYPSTAMNKFVVKKRDTVKV